MSGLEGGKNRVSWEGVIISMQAVEFSQHWQEEF